MKMRKRILRNCVPKRNIISRSELIRKKQGKRYMEAGAARKVFE